MNVVITGSIAYDYLMRFPGRFVEHILPDRLANLSLSFLVDEMHKVRGGCAPNIAYTLALLGERPRLMATAGCDAGEYRDWLEKHGVDTSLLRIYDDCFTATFFVSTDLDQNQIASFYTGAMARARELSFYDLDAEDVEITIISPNDPQAMRKYARECRELGISYIYDPSQQVARVEGEELVEGLVKQPDTLSDKRFVYYLLASTGICVVPLSSFATDLQGFRITLLERDEATFRMIFETIAENIRMYLDS